MTRYNTTVLLSTILVLNVHEFTSATDTYKNSTSLWTIQDTRTVVEIPDLFSESKWIRTDIHSKPRPVKSETDICK